MVIRLVTYVRIPRDAHRARSPGARCSRATAGPASTAAASAAALTVDHVIPRSKGGGSSWDNIVDVLRAVQPAQGRPPAEAGQHAPAARPRAPSPTIFIHVADAEDPAGLGAVPPGSGLVPFMSTYPPDPPRRVVPEDALPPDAPATIEDVRSLRRWLIVVAIWAVAASAIALIALLADDSSSSGNDSSSSQIDRLVSSQQELNDRVDELEKQVQDRHRAPTT